MGRSLPQGMLIKALVIDAQPLVCDALKAMLTKIDPFCTVYAASRLAEAQHALSAAHDLNLIIVEPALPDAARAATLKAVTQQAAARCVVLSLECGFERVFEARAFGAFSYLDKHASSQTI